VDKMASAGFDSLFNLENGIADWNTKGLPVVTS